MDRRGTVAVVEEASWIGETGGIEVDSPPSYGMVCRKALIVQTTTAVFYFLALDITIYDIIILSIYVQI